MKNKKLENKVLENPTFHELYNRKKTISFTLTLFIIIIYIVYILIDAFDRKLLAIKVLGGVTLGIYLGIGVIIIGWITTGIYVWWANKKYDVLMSKIDINVGGHS